MDDEVDLKIDETRYCVVVLQIPSMIVDLIDDHWSFFSFFYDEVDFFRKAYEQKYYSCFVNICVQ